MKNDVVDVHRAAPNVGNGEKPSTSGLQNEGEIAFAAQSQTSAKLAVSEAGKAIRSPVGNHQEDVDDEADRTLVDENVLAQNDSATTNKPPPL